MVRLLGSLKGHLSHTACFNWGLSHSKLLPTYFTETISSSLSWINHFNRMTLFTYSWHLNHSQRYWTTWNDSLGWRQTGNKLFQGSSVTWTHITLVGFMLTSYSHFLIFTFSQRQSLHPVNVKLLEHITWLFRSVSCIYWT